MGLEQMRMVAASPSQGETVAPDWELGERGSPIIWVVPAELEHPEHWVESGGIVQMLQTLALNEIFSFFLNEYFSISSVFKTLFFEWLF